MIHALINVTKMDDRNKLYPKGIIKSKSFARICQENAVIWNHETNHFLSYLIIKLTEVEFADEGNIEEKQKQKPLHGIKILSNFTSQDCYWQFFTVYYIKFHRIRGDKMHSWSSLSLASFHGKTADMWRTHETTTKKRPETVNKHTWLDPTLAGTILASSWAIIPFHNWR